MRTSMNRFTAAIVHMFGSACVVGVVFLLVWLVWYPGRLFAAASGTNLMAILILVDITLGPLITLIVFSPAKSSLKFDLTVVVVLQIAFLLYGVWSIYSARPVYIPFDEDRFYLVTASDIDPKEQNKVKDPAFKSFPMLGPEIVGTVLPDNPEMREKIKFGGLLGMGVQIYPQYYVPYGEAAASVKAVALPAQELMKKMVGVSQEDVSRLHTYEVKKRSEGQSVRFVRLATRKFMLYVAVDEASGDIVEIL